MTFSIREAKVPIFTRFPPLAAFLFSLLYNSAISFLAEITANAVSLRFLIVVPFGLPLISLRVVVEVVLQEGDASPEVMLELELELGEECEVSPDVDPDVVLQEDDASQDVILELELELGEECEVSPDVVLWEGEQCCWGRDCDCSQIN